MTQPSPSHILLSSISKILAIYLSEKSPIRVGAIVTAYNPSIVICPIWTTDCARDRAGRTIASLKTQDDALRLLGFIAQFGTADHVQDLPPIQACVDAIGLTLTEYANLWDGVGDTPFCKVRLSDGTINYNPISHIQDLVDLPTPLAAGIVINSYRDAVQYLDPSSMTTACSTKLSYSNMTGYIQELCGCYINVQNVTEFTTDEKAFLLQKPECTPSCLSAAVRYVKGGIPQTCQQEVCIADKINVTGDSVTISQVCPQCPKRFQCVCYIHVNGKTIDNQACNTAYVVNDQGQITETIHNSAQPASQGLKRGFEAMFRSPVAIVVFLVTAGAIAVVVCTILIVQHTRHRTRMSSNHLHVGATSL